MYVIDDGDKCYNIILNLFILDAILIYMKIYWHNLYNMEFKVDSRTMEFIIYIIERDKSVHDQNIVKIYVLKGCVFQSSTQLGEHPNFSLNNEECFL